MISFCSQAEPPTASKMEFRPASWEFPTSNFVDPGSAFQYLLLFSSSFWVEVLVSPRPLLSVFIHRLSILFVNIKLLS